MKLQSYSALRAEAYKEAVSVPITLCFEYPTSESESVKCRILFDKESDIPTVIESESYPKYFQVRAIRDHGSIWIPQMQIEYSDSPSSWNDSFHGIANLFVEGQLEDFQSLPGTMRCYVLLQDNALLSFYEEDKQTKWATPFGDATLVRDYRYGGYIVDMKERNPQKRNMILIELDPTLYSSLYDLVTELTTYLDELMWLISFFCKKYVHWFQLDMYYEPKEQAEGAGDSFRMIHVYSNPHIVMRNPPESRSPGFENHPADLLVDLKVLRTEIAHTVFSRYFELLGERGDEATIKLILVNLLMSYTAEIFEAKLGIIYTALEIVVDRYSDPYILSDADFAKLRKVLKKCLNSQDRVDLSERQRKEIEKKLSELKRTPYFTRIEAMYGKKLKKIRARLPESITPEILLERLKDAISRRHKYIHQGKIENYGQASGDLALVRLFVSLWVLDMLGYPIDQIAEPDPDISMIQWAIEQGY